MTDEDSLSIAAMVDILFDWGEQQGLNVTYHAIEEATGESWTNIRKIRTGENANPGLRVVQSIARYFEIGLDYFDCQTPEACHAYLKGLDEADLLDEVVRMRAHSLSPKALLTLEAMIDYVQEVEGMKEADSEELDNAEETDP